MVSSFDKIDHTLLLRALEKHTACKWVRLYIGRWLTAPLQLSDGTLVERTKGTPQGGVVSPLLANLFLHYAFDAWMMRTFPGVPWCRYADDGLIHCETETQAHAVLAALADRLAACGLAIHPDKTHIVYCKDGSRKEKHPNTKFDFLGYTFRPRVVKNRKRNSLFVSFTPAVSAKALKAMRATVRRLNYRNRTELSLGTFPGCTIPFCGAGWPTMGGSTRRRGIRSSGTSTRRWWPGRCASSNGSKAIRRGQACFSNA